MPGNFTTPTWERHALDALGGPPWLRKLIADEVERKRDPEEADDQHDE